MDTQQKAILIVEDEPLIAIAMEDLIRDMGFTPIVARAVDQALATIASVHLVLAILDFKIRDENSGPVALVLRAKSIPFLVCSGTFRDRLVGAFDGAPHIDKPYNDEDLQAGILAALAGGQK